MLIAPRFRVHFAFEAAFAGRAAVWLAVAHFVAFSGFGLILADRVGHARPFVCVASSLSIRCFFLVFFVFRLAILYILCYNSYVNGKEVSMKWTDIVTAISSVVSNIIALAALVISIRRRPRHKR